MSKIKDKNIKNIPKVLSEIEIYKRVCEKLVQINTRPRRKLIKFFQNYEGPFKDEILKNFEIASNQQLPLCQDTGIVEFFVWKGYNVIIEKPINEILNKAVKDTYTKMGFRNSVVKDPLLTRQNTLDNTPSIIHIFEIEEPILDIWIIAKGGGSENLSALYMLQPSQGYEGQNGMKDKIIEHVKNNARNACPPIKIGVGVGGTSDESILLSKLALFEKDVLKYNQHVIRYHSIERDLKSQLKEIKIGVQGLGIGEGIYDIKIYGAPTHIATLPVAISVDCYLLRNTTVMIKSHNGGGKDDTERKDKAIKSW